MARKDGRAFDELRPVKVTTDFVKFAEGSCLIECGDTKVLCCASVEDKTPPHVAEGEGWVTAEYSMLPRANRERSRRDIAQAEALRPQRRDPAAHRPVPAGGGGYCAAWASGPSPSTAMCCRATAAPGRPPSPGASSP